MSARPNWWGFSKEHGWVILARDIDCNMPGTRGDLMFFRCRDSKIFFIKWELWKLPAYQLAENYLRELKGDAAEAARSEFEGLLSRSAEFEAELKRQYQEIVDREEAAQREEEKRQKKAASEQRKLRAAGAALKNAEAPSE